MAGGLRDFIIFGERNSGTNFVSALLELNFPALSGKRRKAGITAYGWKHGFPAPMATPASVLAVIVARHPETWVQSMHRTPWHAGPELRDLPIAEFIRTEWRAVVDHRGFGVRPGDPLWGEELLWDRDPETGGRFPNILRLRAAKLRSFLDVADRFPAATVLKYEDVAGAPEAMLDRLAGEFALERAHTYHPIDTARGWKGGGAYVPKTYADLSDADRAFIWGELDPAVEARLGYAPGTASPH